MLFEKIELEAGEEVLQIVRKHWFIIFVELFGAFLLLLVPYLVLFVLAIFPNLLTAVGISLQDYTLLITFSTALWTLLSLLVGFTAWTHYYLDLWVITDRRIISVDQIHFFNRTVSMFRLERLQDIEFKVKGLIPTLLNFGTVQAQTAGAHESNFYTTGLPDPRGLQATIQRAMDKRLEVLHITPNTME